MPLPVRHASEPTQIMPRAWESRGPCNWLHAQLPMQHRKFLHAEKIKKSILMQIHVCNVFDASCCAARIRSHLNNAAGMEIKRHLQLVACAAADAAQEFFVCQKNQGKSILMKIYFCNNFDATSCATRIRTNSNNAASMGIKGPLQLVACAAADAAQEIFACRKNQEIDFDANSCLQRFRCQLLCGTHQKPLK